MDFVKKNSFWFGLAAAGVVYLIIYFGFINGIRTQNKAIAENLTSKYADLGRYGERERLPDMKDVPPLEEYRRLFEVGYDEAFDYFRKRDVGLEEFLADPAGNRPCTSLGDCEESKLKQLYLSCCSDLAAKLDDKGILFAENACNFFDWETRFPSELEALAAQRQFRIHEELIEIFIQSGVRRLEKVDVSLEGKIDATGLYQKLPVSIFVFMNFRDVPVLLSKLLASERMFLIDTVQVYVPTEREQEAPLHTVAVEISCWALDFNVKREELASAK